MISKNKSEEEQTKYAEETANSYLSFLEKKLDRKIVRSEYEYCTSGPIRYYELDISNIINVNSIAIQKQIIQKLKEKFELGEWKVEYDGGKIILS